MDHPGQPGVSRAQVTASDSRCPRAPEGVASRVHAPLLPSPGNRGREPTRLPRLGQYLPFPGRTLERGLIELFRTGAWARGEKRKPRHGSVAEALVPSGAGAVLRQNGPADSPLGSRHSSTEPVSPPRDPRRSKRSCSPVSRRRTRPPGGRSDPPGSSGSTRQPGPHDRVARSSRSLVQ